MPRCERDILLVKPGSQRRLYGELSDFRLTAIEPPFWAALLAAYLRDQGFSVDILDTEAEGLDAAEATARILEAAPLLTAVVVSGTNPSASTMNMTGAGEIVRQLRQAAPERKTLLMGLHPSALPGRTMAEEACDFLCQGEGFYTLPALLTALRDGGDLDAIPGLWRRQDGRVAANPRPPVFPDLDRLPMPAWDKLPMHAYRAHNWHCFDAIGARQPYAVLYTSLGCPFRCEFCCINSLFGKPGMRLRSIENVLAELDVLVTRYGVRNIKILDEMFVINEKRVVELCNRIAERGYDLNIWAYARVNTVTAPMLAAMKAAGVTWLAYGFESGSKRVLEAVSKGYDVASVDRVVAMTEDHGLHICANFIFGLPDDDYDTMQETLEAMFRINAPWANIYSAMAYPGSRLHERAAAEGWPLPGAWQGYSQYSSDCLPLPTKHLSAGQVLAFRDYAFNAYYGNPRYLDRMRRTFGMDTVRHIMAMSTKRLPRRYAEPVAGCRADDAGRPAETPEEGKKGNPDG